MSSTGCVTRTVWDWARDRPDRGACSVAYLDDTGRRVAFQLDDREGVWREFVLVEGWRDTAPGTDILVSAARDLVPPAWVGPTEHGPTRLPVSIGGPAQSRDVIRVRDGHVFAVFADRREVEIVAPAGAGNAAAYALAVCATPVAVVTDVVITAVMSAVVVHFGTPTPGLRAFR